MNTNEVAKLLGVSQSTIQRWVKQLDLRMEKNERGHYLFNPEDIELIKKIQVQIQNGILLHDIPPFLDKKVRKGTVNTSESNKGIEALSLKLADVEKRVNGKADSVVSYQILQHRKEIEDLQSQVHSLLKRIETLEAEVKPFQKIETPLLMDQPKQTKKIKKKNIVSSIFGF